jgi:predicted transcriptional regulator
MKQQIADQEPEPDIRRMAADVIAAYVSANAIPATQLPELIRSVITALQTVEEQSTAPEAEALKPAVPIRRSVNPDYIVCLEDGRKLKMLKRHLRTTYNMSPAEYRAKWSLPADYPMVAPNYAARRSEFAKKIGLGRQAVAPHKRRRAAR